MDQTFNQPNTNDGSKIKAVLYILLVLLVIGGVLFWAMSKQGSKEYVSEMNGVVTAVNGNVITVQGYLYTNPEEPKRRIDPVTIEFTVEPETKIVKNSMMLRTDVPNGEAYEPEIVPSEGVLSDIKPKGVINLIKSNKNLVGVSKAEAEEVHYSIMVFPTEP